MNAPLFKGVITALITPLRDGNVDEAAFAKLLERQIAAGVHGVVPMGTTGEGASMDLDEHKHVIELCVRLTAGRTRVIAGTGSPYTKEAIDLTRHAKAVGADGALIVTPYYIRPSQAGMAAHFEAVADAVQLPIVLYNVPGRTGADLANETVARLAAHPNIVGIKDATGDMSRVAWMRANIGGQFDLMVANPFAPINALIADGKLRVLAVTGPERAAGFPQVPTLGELGYASANLTSLFGFYAPAGTPEAVVQRLNQAINAQLANKEVQDKLRALDNIPLTMGADKFQALIHKEWEANGKVVREANIQAQ